MKFEKLLEIYWTKGFLYGGEIEPFDIPLATLYNNLTCLSKYSFKILKKKLEICHELKKNPLCSNLLESQCRVINIYFAQTVSVNHSLIEFKQNVPVRYYLIRSFRGRCQAYGKPARGQRTWSNAMTAWRTTNDIKFYISKFKKTHVKVEIVKKINFRVVQRKFRKTAPKFAKIKKVKKPATEWL